MRKLFTLFTAILFAGSIFAQATPKVTLDFTSGGVAGQNEWKLPTVALKNTAGTYTKGNYSIGISASSDGHKAFYTAVMENKVATGDTIWQGIIFGKTNTVMTLPAMNFKVAKIIVYWVSAGGSSSVVHNIFVGDNAVSTAVTGCNITASADSSVFNIASASQEAGTVYSLKVTSKHNMQVSKIEFYEASADTPADPTFSVAAGVYQEAQSVELDCETDGADIFYTLDGTTPSASSTKYNDEAIVISETTTIKAIAIKNGISSSVVSATYTIIDVEGDGTKENPFTVGDLIKLNNSVSDTAWVAGYIVGGFNTGSGVIDNTTPSALALGETADAETYIPVQLVGSNTATAAQLAARSALNVKDHSENIGALVKVRGSLEKYCNLPGVKGTCDYVIVSLPTAIDNTAADTKAVKTIVNGQLLIEKDGKFYNVLGTVVR